MDEQERELEALWAVVGEGPPPPSLTVDDIPELRQWVWALSD